MWPTWRAVDTEPVSAGWVGPAGAPFPGDFESLEFFAWLVTHKDVAEPWVPSAEALTAQRAQDGRVDEETFQDRHGVPSVFTSTDRPKRAGQIIFGPRPDLTV